MPRNKNLIMLSTALACFVIMAWLCISIRGESSYEFGPRITVPAYRTDTARAIDAYERMMERFIDMTGKDLTDIEICGEKLSDIAIPDFDFPPLISANFINKLPNFIEQPLRQSLSTRPVVNDATCTLCNICKDVCPAHVISSNEKIVIEYDSCIRCYCCHEICPEEAIQLKATK